MNTIDSKQNCFILKKSIAFFCIGIIIGGIGSLGWQELLNPDIFSDVHVITKDGLKILKSETDEKLLKYIEGKWRSPVGDLIVNINDSDINGSFVVMENIASRTKRQEKYKVISLDKVDGIFGIVKLSICSESSECTEENVIKIQINKIFGIKDTISITYDRRFSHCIEEPDCTRAFKQLKNDT